MSLDVSVGTSGTSHVLDRLGIGLYGGASRHRGDSLRYFAAIRSGRRRDETRVPPCTYDFRAPFARRRNRVTRATGAVATRRWGVAWLIHCKFLFHRELGEWLRRRPACRVASQREIGGPWRLLGLLRVNRER
jgi:hypothetical protein